MVAEKCCRSAAISTDHEGAPCRPAEPPGWLAASLGPAALGSLKPEYKVAALVLSPLSGPPPPSWVQGEAGAAGTHLVLHTQLGSVEQQHLHSSVVAMSHSLM